MLTAYRIDTEDRALRHLAAGPDLAGNIEALFGYLPGDRAALQLIARLAHRFSGSNGYDLVADGIAFIAEDCAGDDGWTGPDKGERYLEVAK